MGVSVVLTDAELAYATKIGEARSNVNAERPDGRISRRVSELEIDIQGATAEFAFHKYYGLAWTKELWSVDEWLRRRKECDAGRVQIKSCVGRNHKLIVPKIDQTAIYVLVGLWDLPTAILCGWVRGSDIPAASDPSLPVPNPALRQSQLESMMTFPAAEAFATVLTYRRPR